MVTLHPARIFCVFNAYFFVRLSGNRNTDSSFNNLGSNLNLWSSSPSGSSNAWNRNLNSSYSTVNRNANTRANGFSVRCSSTVLAAIESNRALFCCNRYSDERAIFSKLFCRYRNQECDGVNYRFDNFSGNPNKN